jgi:hypothetical protein
LPRIKHLPARPGCGDGEKETLMVKGATNRMDLRDNQIKRIEKIMASMECSKDFKCYKSGFEDVCKAKDDGLDGYANCSEGANVPCEFKVHYAYRVLCRCPLRVYAAKNLVV